MDEGPNLDNWIVAAIEQDFWGRLSVNELAQRVPDAFKLGHTRACKSATISAALLKLERAGKVRRADDKLPVFWELRP
jgi:hypothetical protein